MLYLKFGFVQSLGLIDEVEGKNTTLYHVVCVVPSSKPM